MTATSDAIKKLISYSPTDWVVTNSEQLQVINLLRADKNVSASIMALNSIGMLDELISRIIRLDIKYALFQLLGGQLDASTKGLVKPMIGKYVGTTPSSPYFGLRQVFEISDQLIARLKTLGLNVKTPGPASAPMASLISADPTDPYTGSGATGDNPTRQNIPLLDQGLMFIGHDITINQYNNPVGGLGAYLSTLTTRQRLDQAINLVSQAIVTVFPDAYAGRLPNRADVMRKAAKAHNLHPELIAGFILAEQRDQSKYEDAADYNSAVSVLKKNSSIGLGQVVVSTAKDNNLFADLLDASTTGALTHRQIATLLASDEFNIFAVARYIRIVANNVAKISPKALASTKLNYPAINIRAYANNSSLWPDDNIRAMGSEYTSVAWDGKIFSYWGDFVFQAYTHVKNSGVF